MAGALKMTRQRYSRLESGQVDISFVIIKKIADYLGMSFTEITKVDNEKKEMVTLFREKNVGEDIVQSVAIIEKILRVFHAHEKLYYQMKERDKHVDQ